MGMTGRSRLVARLAASAAFALCFAVVGGAKAQTGLLTVAVTQVRGQAPELADRAVIVSGGLLGQVGRPVGVYGEPASAPVCALVDGADALPAPVAAGHLFPAA